MRLVFIIIVAVVLAFVASTSAGRSIEVENGECKRVSYLFFFREQRASNGGPGAIIIPKASARRAKQILKFTLPVERVFVFAEMAMSPVPAQNPAEHIMADSKVPSCNHCRN